MSSQVQLCATRTSPLDRIVTFGLSGRTTLSEHLPSETIDVPFSLAVRSLHLHKLIRKHMCTQPNTPIVPLPDIDPAGFKLFLDFLTSNHITFPAPKSSTKTHNLSLRECIDLLYAHIVGGTLGEPDFQDNVIDQMALILSTKQVLDHKVLDVVFINRKASSVLKNFVMDHMFAEDRKLVSMLRGGREMTDGLGDGTSQCVYHVHHHACHWDKSQIHRTKDSVRPWSADEDPELQAMAEYCLRRNGVAPFDAARHGRVSPTRKVAIVESQTGRDFQTLLETSDESLDEVTAIKASHPAHLSSENSFRDRKEKSLPALPASSCSSIRSRSSPEPPPISPPLMLDWGRNGFEDFRTQELSRRRRKPVSSSDTNTQTIVAECLDRLTRSSSAFDTRPCDVRNSSQTRISAIKRLAVSRVHDIPSSLRPGLPPESPSFLHFESASRESHQPTTPMAPPSDAMWATVDSILRPSIDRSPSLYLPPLVKRKAAPSRGSDWLEQQHRLHMLRGTQGFGLRRAAKKGRLSMLREAFLGSVNRNNDGRPSSAAI